MPTDKQALRRLVRSRFPGAEARSAESALLCAALLNSSLWRGARTLAAYVPLAYEADSLPLLTAAWQAGKRVLLPRVAGNTMDFCEAQSLADCVPDRYGIPAPGADCLPVALAEADLLLVPLEAIDPLGYRLGKGGGWYDRALADRAAGCFALGLALRHQWVECVPRDKHDMPLDGCATADGIRLFRARG